MTPAPPSCAEDRTREPPPQRASHRGANFTQTRELRRYCAPHRIRLRRELHTEARTSQVAAGGFHTEPPSASCEVFFCPSILPHMLLQRQERPQAAHFPNNHFPPPLQSLWRPKMNTMGVENDYMSDKSAVGFSQAPMKHTSTLSHPQQAATFNVYGRGRLGEPALKGII